jgi:hypothetical protein
MMLCARGVGKRAESAASRDVQGETAPIAPELASFFARATSISNSAEQMHVRKRTGDARIRIRHPRAGISAKCCGADKQPQITAALRVLIGSREAQSCPFKIATGEGEKLPFTLKRTG